MGGLDDSAEFDANGLDLLSVRNFITIPLCNTTTILVPSRYGKGLYRIAVVSSVLKSIVCYYQAEIAKMCLDYMRGLATSFPFVKVCVDNNSSSDINIYPSINFRRR